MARPTGKAASGFARLKLWQKFGLIAAPFLLPIAALLYIVVSQNNKDIEVAQAEVRGQVYLRPVKDLNNAMARHRGLASRFLLGDRSVQADLGKAVSQADDAIRAIDTVDAKLGKEFKTDERGTWKKVKEDWAAAKNFNGLKPDESFAKHTDAINSLGTLVGDVWEISNLILDPEAETYYLQDMMIANLLLGSESVGQTRAITAAALTRTEKKLTKTEEIQLNILLGQIEGTRGNLEKEVARAVKATPFVKGKIEPVYEDYNKSLAVFTAKIRSVLEGRAEAITPAEVFAAGNETIAAISKMYDTYDPLLEELLNQRASSYRQTSLYSILGTAIALLLVSGVVYLVTRNILGQVSHLNDTFAKIGGGDYNVRAPVESTDEIGQMATSLNGMLDTTLVLIQSRGEKEDIQRSIMKLLDEVSGVADGDLTKEAEVSADMTGAIADSFNFMIDQLRKIIGNVQQATLQVSTAANKIYS
ncbi:MAG: HAMP domain-containing protein, partial [Gemmataceae bacterium]